MQPTSDAFNAAMASDVINVAQRLDLYTSGLTSIVATDLQLVGGSVTEDRTASNRRVCTLNVLDDSRFLIPAFTGSNRVQPGPLEAVVSRGVNYPDGTTELVQLGVFRVALSDVTDTGGGPTLAITGYDRSRTVQRAKLTTLYYIPAGTGYITAAQTLVDNRLPFNVPVNKIVESVQPTTTASPLIYLETDDPWAHVVELATAVGCEIFFDRNGSLHVRDIPDPTANAPVFQFVDGDTCVVTSFEHVLSDDPGVNAVTMIGNDPGNASGIPRATVVDAVPTSPTYYFGPYGQVPETITDPTLITSAQCQVAAAARLRQHLGLTETVTLATVPNPALDVSDVVQVTRAASAIDVPIVIESIITPLDLTTAQSIVGRARQASA